MSVLDRYKQWRDRRRDIGEARELWREGRRILRWRKHRLSPALHDELQRAVLAIQTAIKQSDARAISESKSALDELLQKKLAYLMRAPWREQVEGIAVMVGLALFLRAFVVEAFQIPSGSMIPTLQVGDRIFVNKFVYGVRIPFTLSKILPQPPHRGDIIVFNSPERTDIDLIKRVVAVGGDEVELRDGLVYVNDKPVARAPVPGRCEYNDFIDESQRWVARPCNAFSDSVDDRKFTTLTDPLHRNERATWPKTFVPPRTVFVLGDNRDNSKDSRYLGFVPIEYIKGRAMFIWYSGGQGTWPANVRTERLFKSVD